MKTALISCVGADDEGTLLLSSLSAIGVEPGYIQRSTESKTGLVIVTVRDDGQRNMLNYRGANNYRRIELELEKGLSEAAILHISDPLPREVRTLAELLHKNKPAITSIDPGSMTAVRGLEQLRSLLTEMKICFLNEGELTHLTGCSQQKEAISTILSCGPEIVVIKRGSRGCLVADGKESFEVPGFKINALDSTGAGDAFDAGFLYGIFKGFSLPEAARFANAVGALSTRGLGAQSSQPTLQEVEMLLSGERE
jgi:ribokinase